MYSWAGGPLDAKKSQHMIRGDCALHAATTYPAASAAVAKARTANVVFMLRMCLVMLIVDVGIELMLS